MYRNILKLVLGLAASLPMVAMAAAQERVLVEVDRAQIMRLDNPAASVIVGNPGIADAAISDVRTIVLTGKSFGTTNLIILDSDGTEIVNKTLEVRYSSQAAMTVYRGPVRQSYSCSPTCEPALAAGDNKDYFELVLGQTQSRNENASGVAK